MKYLIVFCFFAPAIYAKQSSELEAGHYQENENTVCVLAAPYKPQKNITLKIDPKHLQGLHAFETRLRHYESGFNQSDYLTVFDGYFSLYFKDWPKEKFIEFCFWREGFEADYLTIWLELESTTAIKQGFILKSRKLTEAQRKNLATGRKKLFPHEQ